MKMPSGTSVGSVSMTQHSKVTIEAMAAFLAGHFASSWAVVWVQSTKVLFFVLAAITAGSWPRLRQATGYFVAEARHLA